ncbi:hypothetical protein AGMMS49957_11190 [Synergistales bacterium]|nr:hypothetical protein AGMMS49957_11190 [Synergistales bacterium]
MVRLVKTKGDVEARSSTDIQSNTKARDDTEIQNNAGTRNKTEVLSDNKTPLLHYETASEYLSGNIRKKLNTANMAAETEPELYGENVAALEATMPRKLEAHEIDVRLGATWLDKDYIQQFMYELLYTPRWHQDAIRIEFSSHASEWHITSKSRDGSNVRANSTYGTERMNAYEILESTLNLHDVRVYDSVPGPDGKNKSVLNGDESAMAQIKQDAVKNAFKDWIFRDPERREALVEKYNEIFNQTRPREYDGSHLKFPGMNPMINLNAHQTGAIAHILYGGNTLLAHSVGAGKTFEMIASIMESKRLGVANKSLMVVPNHLTEQTAAEFLKLYPSANILVARKKDFETANRKKFCARIATGDYDAVIIGHSQFEKIPVSTERQSRFIQEQMTMVEDAIEEMRADNDAKFTVKKLEKSLKSLQVRLKDIASQEKKDDVIEFEQLGIDRLYVDEAHYYKNLFLVTKMHNVAGIPQSEAQKSADMFIKCRYMDELTGGRGVVFATGTPVSNSMTELYTMMRYLQYDTLKDMGLEHFDSWASTFGETATSIELAPEGSGYRARTRFAKFYNLPELMSVFKETADIKTADMLNLPKPEAEFITVSAEPTVIQKRMIKYLASRANAVRNRRVEPWEDNMLAITTDGRKIGLDQRLMNPKLPDAKNSKVNSCLDNIYKIWDDTKENRLTQAVFCDFSTPGTSKGKKFNVYDDIKWKLVRKGIPENEIAFIHDCDTDIQKKELFAKVRSGSVRIVFGSTQKMGVGTNMQDRLIALHDLDCPWRPSDLEQRSGRILRQGNTNPKVQIYRYITKGTFDSYLYQTVELKQKFISQIMTSKNPVRSCEDVDESVLSYAEIKALAAGNPKIKEKMELDVQVAKLRMAKTNHQNTQYSLQDQLRKIPGSIKAAHTRIERLSSDVEMNEKNKFIAVEDIEADISGKTDGQDEQGKSNKTDKQEKQDKQDKQEKQEKQEKQDKNLSPMTLNGVVYETKDEAGKALMELLDSFDSTRPISVGNYRGFDMELDFNIHFAIHQLTLTGKDGYKVNLGDSASGNITRINNVLDGIQNKIAENEQRIEEMTAKMNTIQGELDKPFAQEEELAEKSGRLTQLNLALNIDNHSGDMEADEDLSLDEDEEYSFKAELEELGMDEQELFSRKADLDVMPIRDEPNIQEATILESEEGVESIENLDGTNQLEDDVALNQLVVLPVASIDTDGRIHVTTVAASETPQISENTADDEVPHYATVSDWSDEAERYGDYKYPIAAAFLDAHGFDINNHANWDDSTYRTFVEGTVNAVLQTQGIVKESLNPYKSNPEYHFIRDSAMSILCQEFDMPDFPKPEAIEGFSIDEAKAAEEKGQRLADFALYGQLPQAEREGILRDRNALQTDILQTTEVSKMSGVSEVSEVSEVSQVLQISQISQIPQIPENITDKKAPYLDVAAERKAVIAEARRKLSGSNIVPIITDAIEGRAYEGKIVEIGSAYAVQEIEEGRGIVHNLRYLKDFTRLMKNTDAPYLQIVYDQDMNGSVDMENETKHGKVASMGR